MKPKIIFPLLGVLAITAAGMVALSCGTEEAGTNGPSQEYFPVAVGDSWSYDTFNLTRDPTKAHPIFTHVSVENIAVGPGEAPLPTFVTKYAKRDDGEGFRLNQAGYWVNKDIFFKYDHFAYDVAGNDYFDLRGYNYLNEYREPVIGLYFHNENGQRTPLALFKTPLQTGAKWDVLNRLNTNINVPTVFRNMDQKEWFGLPRDINRDNAVDTMDISIVGEVDPTMEMVPTPMGQLSCYKVKLTYRLVFHLSGQGDDEDVSTTTYWIAPYYGIMKMNFHIGSTYLDNIEMKIKNAWYIQ